MSHRCRDDWFWLSLLLIACQGDAQRCSCPPEPLDEWRDDDPPIDPRATATSKRFWQSRKAWAVGAALVVMGYAFAPAREVRYEMPPLPLLANSAASPTVDAVSAEPAPSDGRHDEATANAAPDVETPAPPLNASLPSHVDEAMASSLLLDDIRAPDITLLSTRFDVGSTRDEVLSAQGSAPTYATHDGRSIWWGSSKVTFSPEDRVTGWTAGTPRLMTRR